ncbi:transporter substrate-binding domain-containing protein [Ferrimicrobium sp.]|uniref:substrate-binding periplasmic protein n=1 Tax=Ferrimicrobium sp. TaxID=2926050 RepID=UPI0026082B95|nr:transporter substrate-binding domain-containing protein [Ferrimicrobium sp.]
MKTRKLLGKLGRSKGRGLRAAGVLAVAASMLAACGSASTSSSTGATGMLAQVESSHQLIIAMSAYAPEDFQNSSGKWTGYDPVILSAFAKTIGAKLVIDAIPFAASVEAVATHRADITIDIYYTKARAQVIAFSRPMLNYDDVVAVSKTHPQVTKDTVKALSGKNIAVVTGSEEVNEANKTPNAHVIQYSNIEETFLALGSGRVAADYQPDTDVSWAIHQDPSLDVKILGPMPTSLAPPIASLRGYYGVPKGSYGKEFLQRLNAYLKKIECNGTEQKMIDQFGMQNPVYLAGLCTAANVYNGS